MTFQLWFNVDGDGPSKSIHLIPVADKPQAIGTVASMIPSTLIKIMNLKTTVILAAITLVFGSPVDVSDLPPHDGKLIDTDELIWGRRAEDGKLIDTDELIWGRRAEDGKLIETDEFIWGRRAEDSNLIETDEFIWGRRAETFITIGCFINVDGNESKRREEPRAASSL
uniref:Uncharacterized protein n=1 Tax=Moniliophthora roreri TaxID=221103 RepID=A0A0W0FIE7_MONRR